MTDNLCQDVRNQVMFYIDNELSEDKRIWLAGHINKCADCQEYICHEQDLKTKICEKLKGKTMILAGYPTDQIEAYKEYGISSFIHIRADLVSTLAELAVQMEVIA